MTIKPEKIILGIDPGTNIMGYGLLKVNGNKASMMAMGVIDMRKIHDPYLKLGRIFDRVSSLIKEFLPDEMAIEAPFSVKHTIDAQTWQSTRSCYCSSDTLRYSNTRICPIKN